MFQNFPALQRVQPKVLASDYEETNYGWERMMSAATSADARLTIAASSESVPYSPVTATPPTVLVGRTANICQTALRDTRRELRNNQHAVEKVRSEVADVKKKVEVIVSCKLHIM